MSMREFNASRADGTLKSNEELDAEILAEREKDQAALRDRYCMAEQRAEKEGFHYILGLISLHVDRMADKATDRWTAFIHQLEIWRLFDRLEDLPNQPLPPSSSPSPASSTVPATAEDSVGDEPIRIYLFDDPVYDRLRRAA